MISLQHLSTPQDHARPEAAASALFLQRRPDVPSVSTPTPWYLDARHLGHPVTPHVKPAPSGNLQMRERDPQTVLVPDTVAKGAAKGAAM